MTQEQSENANPPAYEKGDFRKTVMVLAAIRRLQDEAAIEKAAIEKAKTKAGTAGEKARLKEQKPRVPGATIVRIASATGLDKKTIISAIRIASVQAGVHVTKERAVYEISDWGPLLSPKGALLALEGRLEGSFTEDGVLVDDPLPAYERKTKK